MNPVRWVQRWWYRTTHAPCPVCGQSLNVGREWHEHKAGHNPQLWRAALRLPPVSDKGSRP